MDSFALPPPHPDENILDVSDVLTDVDSKSSRSVTFSIDADDVSTTATSSKESPRSEQVTSPSPFVDMETQMFQHQQQSPQVLNGDLGGNGKENAEEGSEKKSERNEIGKKTGKVNSTEAGKAQNSSISKLEVKQQQSQRLVAGKPSPQHLEVLESPFIRSSSNSAELRRFAEIKRHKRSVSDYSSSAGDISVTSTTSGTNLTTRASTEVSDFSDPLQDYQRSKNENIFSSEHQNIKFQDDTKSVHTFKKALTDTMISISPLLKFEVPYLETITGRNCKLRRYFPASVYWSAQFEDGGQRSV